MLNIEQVLNNFAQITGMEFKKACLYQNIAELVVSDVESRLKENVSLNELALKKLTYLAAAILNYRYLLITGNGNAEIASMSNIVNGGLDIVFSARKIKDIAFIDCKDYLKDEEFTFERINENDE